MSAARSTANATRGGLLAVLALALAACVPTPPLPSVEQPVDSTPVTPVSTSPAGVEPMSEHDVPELMSITTDEILPGQCIAGMPPGLVAGQTLTVLPCADQHNAELIVDTENDADSFPGEEAVQQQADRWCDDLLPAIADGVPESSVYLAVAPDEARWQDGDRRMLCFVVAIDAYYTGSFVGGNAEVHTA